MRTAILGVGLIGGSLGLALRAAGWPVVGWGPRRPTLELAIERGAIDSFSLTAEEAIEGAELIVAAGPIRNVPDAFQAVARAAADGAVVTDVASVKGQVMAWARDLLPQRVLFCGGHPMAGREVEGVAGAEATLFRGCTYCLVPRDEGTLPVMEALVRTVGAEPLLVEAADHDRAVAASSHLPFLAASALVRAIEPQLVGLGGAVASSGFRDTTRVAMASPGMHADICKYNAAALGETLDRLCSELSQLRQRLDDAELQTWFEDTATIRREWQHRRSVIRS